MYFGVVHDGYEITDFSPTPMSCPCTLESSNRKLFIHLRFNKRNNYENLKNGTCPSIKEVTLLNTGL